VPKRSNYFQRLVPSIHHQLAGSAKVTESAMLRDQITGVAREVDVVIESVAAGHAVTLSIECCDLTRKATVEWVEHKWSKHASLPTDKLVLSSRSGFTRQALAKAKAYGIDTYDLKEAAKVDWTSVVHKTNKIIVDGTDIIFMLYAGAVASAKNPSMGRLLMGQEIRAADGRSTTVRQFTDAFVANQTIQKALLEPVPKDSDAGWSTIIPLNPGVHTIDDHGRRIDLKAVTLILIAKRRTTPIELKAGQFGDYEVAYGETDTDLGSLLITILEKPGQKPRAALLRRRGKLDAFATLSGPAPDDVDATPNDIMRALCGRHDSGASFTAPPHAGRLGGE